MKISALQFFALAILIVAATKNFAQQNLAGNASDFTSVEYYPDSNPAQIKSRLSGAQAQPLPGGLLVIKEFKLELFATNGQPQAIVRAPDCTYDSLHGVANSAGQLFLQNGDGKIRIKGDGFLWRRTDSFLTISNHVRTEIDETLSNAVGIAGSNTKIQ